MTVALGGIGTCALMQHHVYLRQVARFDAQTEVIFMLIIGDLAPDQVPEFIAFREVVDHQNIGIAAAIEPAHQIAADETGAASYHDHESSPTVTTDVPSLPTTIPPARLAHPTESSQVRPAPRATANVASTVSPAPDTSKTSCACASI